MSDFGGSAAAIQYTLTGPDLAKLTAFADHAVEKLRQVPGAVDVISLIVGKPEIRLAIDRARASTLGVEPIDVASTLQLLVGGLKVSTFSERGEDYDIRARALREYRVDSRGLLITVPSRTVGSVPLDSVVNIVPSTRPSSIDRTEPPPASHGLGQRRAGRRRTRRLRRAPKKSSPRSGCRRARGSSG